METLRKSDRRDGGSDGLMMDKATRRLEEKCNSAAKKNPKGTNLDPIFAILQDIPDAHFLSVASDSCVLFPSSDGQAAEALSLIRANELAQAALASTRVRLEQEQLAARAKEKDVLPDHLTEGGPRFLMLPQQGLWRLLVWRWRRDGHPPHPR